MNELATLIPQAVAGDEVALTALLERFGPEVARALHISPQWRSAVDADDVMQVTYLEAFLEISRFKGRDETSFLAWLRRIAENNLRDAIKELERDKRPQNRIEAPLSADSYVSFMDRLAQTTTTPSRVASGRELQQMVEGALRQLPPDYERALRLFELEERNSIEVAEAMQRSPGAVRMLAARARDRLAEILTAHSSFSGDTA